VLRRGQWWVTAAPTIVTEHRASAYWQFCLAHLIRDVKFLLTLPGREDQAYGQRLREALRQRFAVIHRREQMTAAVFQQALQVARKQVLQHLRLHRTADRLAAHRGDRPADEDRLGPRNPQSGRCSSTQRRTDHTAERITPVMDNLNTHSLGSLYEAFAPEEARRIIHRIEVVHTPKHGSCRADQFLNLG
jgi:hypothetical protein